MYILHSWDAYLIFVISATKSTGKYFMPHTWHLIEERFYEACLLQPTTMTTSRFVARKTRECNDQWDTLQRRNVSQPFGNVMICPPRPLIPDMSTFEKVRWPHLATWCYIAAPSCTPLLHRDQGSTHKTSCPAWWTACKVHWSALCKFQVRASQIHKRLL